MWRVSILGIRLGGVGILDRGDCCQHRRLQQRFRGLRTRLPLSLPLPKLRWRQHPMRAGRVKCAQKIAVNCVQSPL